MEISIDIKGNIRRHILKGPVDINALMGYLKQVYNTDSFDMNMDAFWDMRDADFSSVTTEEINHIMLFVSSYWGSSVNNRVALISPDGLGFGFSRMFGQLMETRYPGNINVFRDIDKAEEWINNGKKP